MSTSVTFEEFQSTRFETSDLGAALGLDVGILDPVSGNGYCGSLYIEQVPERTPNGDPNEYRSEGKWHVVIENSTEIGDDLAKFERELYNWAVGSGYSSASLPERVDREIEMLCQEYKAWSQRNNLNLGSADQHLCDKTLTPEQLIWLRNFSKRWENSTPVHTAGGIAPGRMR